MTTPICDFVRQYAKTKPIRLHMPGHKGRGPLGAERWDITEIDGADDLFAPAGVIEQSEQNAGALFGAKTLYSTAGSTLCIQAMVYLAALAASAAGAKPLILAARNAHKAFLHAAALLDVQVPTVTIPVKPGRNLSIIIEVAAMNNRQKKMGFNAAKAFTEQLDAHFGLGTE